MIRTIIVDDEPRGRRALSLMLARHCPDVQVVAEADSAVTGAEAILRHAPDLVFLDIEMPGGGGFELLESLDTVDFDVIFVTAYDQYAIRAIRNSAVDYLLKPTRVDELRTAVARSSARREQRVDPRTVERRPSASLLHADKIPLPMSNGFIFVSIRSILRCEARSNYTMFYFDNGTTTLVSKTLGEFESLLSDHEFCRVHNSHIINMRHVERYIKGKTGIVVLSDGSQVEVSPRKKSLFMQYFPRM